VDLERGEQYTFLTGLNEIKKEPHELVQSKLNVCVENIEGQFQHVLSKHEEDFLNAYKVLSPCLTHMCIGPHD
jgi:ubiquitin